MKPIPEGLHIELAGQRELIHHVGAETLGDPAAWAAARRWLADEAEAGDQRAAITLLEHAEPGCARVFDAWSRQGGALAIYGLAGLLRLGRPVARELAQALASASGLAATIGRDALMQCDGPEAVELLLAQLESTDPATRHQAFHELVKRFDIPPEHLGGERPFGLLGFRLSCTVAAVYRPACARLREIFRELQEGNIFELLVPPYQPSAEGLFKRVRAGLDWYAPWDLSAIDALSPHDRAWVDANALVRASQDSLSAAAAIPLLRPAEGLEVLEAMLREARASDDEARAVYRQAIAAWKAGKPAAGGRAATPPAAAGS